MPLLSPRWVTDLRSTLGERCGRVLQADNWSVVSSEHGGHLCAAIAVDDHAGIGGLPGVNDELHDPIPVQVGDGECAVSLVRDASWLGCEAGVRSDNGNVVTRHGHSEAPESASIRSRTENPIPL